MNNQIRYPAYSLLGISIVLTLLLAYPDANRSSAKAHVNASNASLVPRNAGMVEEGTVTLKAADIKTFTLENRAFPSNTTYWPCGGYPTHGIGVTGPRGEGDLIAGYDHYFDAGTKPFPCQERLNHFYRGGVWFDLSEIRSKLPGVFVTSASLHFRKVESETRMDDGKPFPGTKYCANELLVASADWRKGLPSGSLLPAGSFFHSLSELPPKGASFAGVKCDLGGGLGGLFFCSVEVGPVVNNWVTGKEDDFGFVFKGEDEALKTEDNAACWTLYDNFELVVNYKYDAAVKPKKPDIPVDKTPPGPGGSIEIRKNYALTANGGMASASSKYDDNYAPSAAINGEVLGIHKGSDPATGSLWHSETPTFPQWLEVDFKGGDKVIDEIDLFTFQDKVDAPESVYEGTTTFSPDKYGLTQFQVQYWHYKFGWVDIPNTIFTAAKPNGFVWNRFKLEPNIQTSKIRVLTQASGDGYSRIAELQAWGK
jgi:hypothetical protein